MKKVLCMLLVICLTFALCACGSTKEATTTTETATTEAAVAENTAAETPASDPIEIKLVTTNSSNNPEVIAMVEHCKTIKERTNGMVDIQVYADGQMLVYAEGIEAVMSNSSVIYFTACNLFSDYVPEFTTVYMPYLFSDTDIATKFFKSDVWNQIVEKADEAGLHVICNNIFTGYRHTFADRAINSPADFEGLTMRIPDSTLYIETFKALKANYQPMAFSDVYSSLQTGMLQGVEGTPATIYNYSLFETMDKSYYSMTKHILDNGGYFIGAEFWNSIPEEYRTIIEEELYAAAEDGNEANAASADEYVKKLSEAGVEIVEIEDLTPFKEAVAELVNSQPMGAEVLAQIAEIEAAG